MQKKKKKLILIKLYNFSFIVQSLAFNGHACPEEEGSKKKKKARHFCTNRFLFFHEMKTCTVPVTAPRHVGQAAAMAVETAGSHASHTQRWRQGRRTTEDGLARHVRHGRDGGGGGVTSPLCPVDEPDSASPRRRRWG